MDLKGRSLRLGYRNSKDKDKGVKMIDYTDPSLLL